MASAGFSVLFNVYLVRKLPLIEGVLVIIHIFGFFGVVVTMWVLSPTGDPKTVFVCTPSDPISSEWQDLSSISFHWKLKGADLKTDHIQ